MAITYGEIAGAEPSTVTFEVATVVIERNSTAQHQEILVLGDPETSNAITRVVAGAPDSTHFGAVVRQVGFVAFSTLVTVRQSTAAEFQATVSQVSTAWAVQHSGPIIVRSTAASALVTAYQSTAADLNVTVAGYVAPSTTITVRQSTAGDLQATVAQASTVWAVQQGGYVAPSTTVTVRQSTYTDLHGLMRLADRDQSTQVANITNTDPASTAWALSVRQVGGTPGSTTMTVRQSTAADLQATVTQASTVWAVQQGGYVAPSTLATVRQSTAADFQATVTQVSTVWAVQHSGRVVIGSTAAEALVTVYQSTASALQATARLNTSSGGGVEGSTTSPAHNVIGLHTREVLSSLQSTTLIITSSNSTAVYPLVSSAAASHKVYAYFLGSTVTVPSTLVFMSSLATDKWAVAFGSGSSGITGANVAVSPPGFLFRTVVNEALNCRVESGSTGQLTRLSLSWFTE